LARSESVPVAGSGAAERIVAVIPARYASTRFPGKALASIAGKPMIQRVWERMRRAQSVTRAVVATDDERIAAAVRAFGGEVEMTRGTHRSGTERVAEVASRLEAAFFVNVQGDEPLLDPAAIDAAVEALLDDADAQIATLAVRIASAEVLGSPHVVKVVTDFEDNALYFSRAPIPWLRVAGRAEGPAESDVAPRHLKHIGLYVFRRAALLEFPLLPPGALERAEQLEQLRWLENGYRIRVVETGYDSIAVDVPEDVARVEEILRQRAAAERD
jgi:3-deoxy-manno-octulosonate cytidylyltransferase (CMP-KDO synthetase)